MTQASAKDRELLRLLEQRARARATNKLADFKPYERQAQFFAMGATKRERAFLAGTQVGKSEALAFELACHLTGLYPPWWQGRRFDHPTRCWACAETAEQVRDVGQTKLLGIAGSEQDYGTGMIPRALLLSKTASRAVADGVDMVRVKHITGGVSSLGFKAYAQGRSKFQGVTRDCVWVDEEPDDEIYSECLSRLTGQGVIFSSLTPLLGFTPFVNRFLRDDSVAALRDRRALDRGGEGNPPRRLQAA
jgi:phage terminase large subunit-like protein